MRPLRYSINITLDGCCDHRAILADEELHRHAELVRGDLGKAVQQLKRESGNGLLIGGVKLPLALAELGLIDEYEFLVHPRLAGHGPTLFAGLSKRVDLKLVSRLEFGSGVVVMRYEPRR
jgi:dihydrofolate reductase